jgi:hypothetical protein
LRYCLLDEDFVTHHFRRLIAKAAARSFVAEAPDRKHHGSITPHATSEAVAV